MTVPLAQSSSLMPVQEIYCVCSGLNAHCIIRIPNTVQKDIESEGEKCKKCGWREKERKEQDVQRTLIHWRASANALDEKQTRD